MRKLVVSTLVIALLPAAAIVAPPAASEVLAAADPITFNIDRNHSSVGFRVRHLGISRVTGTFGEFEGTFIYDPDNPSASSVSVTVQVASIHTGVERRDNHLRSADFFEVETYPEMTFVSSAVRAIDDENLEIDGNLTIHGVTRQVTLATEFLGMVERAGGWSSAFEATAEVNRHDFGLTWNRLQEGLQVVGDEVEITIQVEAHTPREG